MDRYYATLRLIFPNVDCVTFRKTNAAATVHHINCLAQLESALWANWLAELSVESPASNINANATADVSGAGCCWQSYAIYRLHPFGLQRINGRHITVDDVERAEDQYQLLDQLVALLTPASRIHRHMDRLVQLEQLHLTPPDPSITPDQHVDHHLFRKRAVRSVLQPCKVQPLQDTSHFCRFVQQPSVQSNPGGCVRRF